MQITKKDKTNFDAINYCVKAKAREIDQRIPGTEFILIKKNQAITTDGHRLHIARVKDIPDGLYEYSKAKSLIFLKTAQYSNAWNSPPKFPDVSHVIPKTFFYEVTADTKEFLHIAKMAKIMIADHYQGICLTFNGCLNIKVVNPDLGDMTGDVFINKAVKPEIKLGINLKYLIDALKGLDKEVTIGLQESEGKPIIIRDENRSALIMPMRI